jgi:hypothetical protein
MNLKSIMTGAAIAATVVSASVVVSAPAQAAALNLAGSGRLEVGGTTSTLNFSPFNSTGGVAIDVNTFTSVPVLDILLTNTGANSWSLSPSSVPGFLTGSALGSFTLTQFDLVRTPNVDPLLTQFDAIVKGVFGDGSVGSGTFSTESNGFIGAGGTAYSLNLTSTPVPTPALLPGLVGLGVAALRKRKGEGAEKETVGVKA